ncbi:MAG: EAL domain-containing protein [Methylobacteriaceae bacterium]|nr:EAL domain-containing protein [Methylobacteriaceae bacterium]
MLKMQQQRFRSPGELSDAGAILAEAAGSPLCYVVDDEEGVRYVISDALQSCGVATQEFDCASSLLEAVAETEPQLIFLDLSLTGSDAVDALRGLAALAYRGVVQLISGRFEALLKNINQIGQRHSLRMLPVLRKPFRRNAIRKIVQDLGLTQSSPEAWPPARCNAAGDRKGESRPSVRLDEALAKGWVEFWYQPIFDFRADRLAGAELLARVKHPDHGVLAPASFLASAQPDDLRTLAKQAVVAALDDWSVLSAAGGPLWLAINIPVTALTALPIPALVRELRPKDSRWPGLILEVTEDQIMRDIPLAHEVATQLRLYGVTLAIDDFGAGYSSLSRLREMPFSALKLDGSFVANCATDDLNFGICKTVVELAHRFGSIAIAEGIENAADFGALRRMGCDMGQGYLIARPMPKAEFLDYLGRRHGLGPRGAAIA